MSVLFGIVYYNVMKTPEYMKAYKLIRVQRAADMFFMTLLNF